MFSECTALRTVVMEGLPAIAQQMFYGCTSLTEIDMPSSITAVGQYSFQDCTNLERVTFKENIQTITIGSWAFYGCTKLSSVLLPQSLHVLNSETFRDCTSLRKVVFPNQTQTSSADNIFKNCTSLEEVILPVSLSIVAGQFDNCTSLSKLYVLSTTPPTVADATNYYADPFNNVPTETCVVYVPEGAKKNYVNDSKWSVFANIEELTDPLAVTYCVGEVATTSAQLNGFIAVGWLDVTEVGFEYWSADDDEATTVMVSDGNITTGTISYNLSDLVYGMRYTYRAYAKTATATFYGDEVSFALAIEGAHVFTLEVSDLTETTAVLNGRLVLPYGESITEMGFIYWATATPNVMHVIIVDNDALTYTLDGLTPETNYIYRAYAILADGSTIYGDDVAFTTLEDTTTGIDSISAYDLDSDNVEGYYTPDGRKINTPQKGVTIVRFTDGTVKKLFIK